MSLRKQLVSRGGKETLEAGRQKREKREKMMKAMCKV